MTFLTKYNCLSLIVSKPIHCSFITKIYIAPLQGYYSEALPILAKLKRTIFRVEWNVSERTLGSNRRANGSQFHTEGPTTENARVCPVKVGAKGTRVLSFIAVRREKRAVPRQPCV